MFAFLLGKSAAILLLVPINTVKDVWFAALNDIATQDLPAAFESVTYYVTKYWVEGDTTDKEPLQHTRFKDDE